MVVGSSPARSTNLPTKSPRDSGSLLHEYLPRFVVARLPDTDYSAVRLNLVDISAWNPDLLRRVYRRCHNGGRRHDRRRDDPRPYDRIGQDSADNSADEPGPEVASSMSPSAMMAMMMHRRRRRTVVPHRSRAMVHHRARSTEAAAMTAEARAGTGHKRPRRQNRAKYKYKFLVHFVFPFSALRLQRDRVGHPQKLTKKILLFNPVPFLPAFAHKLDGT